MKKIMCIFRLSVLVGCMSTIIVACRQQTDPEADQLAEVVTPVHTVGVTHATLSDYTELTAVSSYQQQSYIKAIINGYVRSVNISPGKPVQAGTLLFSLITKEASAIGNSINELDHELNFSGVSFLRANQSGFITDVRHQKGDYVQDGETLAVISNQKSLVFLLNLPYELHQLVSSNKNVDIILSDGETLPGIISGSLPAVDTIAQTQQMIISINTSHAIPAGLIAKVKLKNISHVGAQVLPKSAVLANETEDAFWVMKMINDSTAVKVLIKKGMENGQFTEILNPVFKVNDRIISVGNYGIADTAKVKVVKQL